MTRVKVTPQADTRMPAGGEGEQVPAPVAAQSGDARVLDPAALEGIRSLQRPSGPDLAGRVIGIYLDNGPRLVESMARAAAGDDAQALAAAAHSLKSSSANLGAQALAGLCKELEVLGRGGSTENAVAAVRALEVEFARVCAALEKERDRV